MNGLSIDKIRTALEASHGGVSESSTDGQCRILWDSLTEPQRSDALAAGETKKPEKKAKPYAPSS